MKRDLWFFSNIGHEHATKIHGGLSLPRRSKSNINRCNHFDSNSVSQSRGNNGLMTQKVHMDLTNRTHNLLLSGPPGVGKTTLLMAVSRNLSDQTYAGFFTQEIREGKDRVGFALVSLAGDRRIMAHRDLVSAHRVGRYGVDVESINYIVDLTLGPDPTKRVYLVDEIGKMELLSPRFVRAVKRLLKHPTPFVATVAQSGRGLIESVKRRSDTLLWAVDRSSRDPMVVKVQDWIKTRLNAKYDYR